MRTIAIDSDRSLVLREAERPQPGRGEAVVDVAYCGVCGSDLHLRPSEAIPVGAVMGHEFSGRVAELGAGVDGWEAGERVCVFPFAPCGECEMCRSGREHLCLAAAATGIGLGANPGAYAEAVLVAVSSLFRLPEEVSDEHGALVEPLAVGVHGVRLSGTENGDAVAVIGAGPIGTMTALALGAEGYERIAVVEPNERRRERIESLGFTAVDLENAHMGVFEALGGELPHAVFECAGHPSALGLGLELVRPAGTIVALGVLEEPVPINQLLLIVKEATVRGSFAYSKRDFADAIALVAAGELPGEKVITEIAPLERAWELFNELSTPGTEQMKVLLRP